MGQVHNQPELLNILPVSVIPGYTSNYWYTAGLPAGPSVLATLAIATGTIYYYPIAVTTQNTFQAMNINVTANVGLTNVAFAIYSSNSSFTQPSGDALKTKVLAVSGTGSKSGSFAANIVLPQGLYWLAIQVDGIATLSSLTVSSVLGLIGSSTPLTTAVNGFSQTFSYSSGTFPTAGSLSAITGASLYAVSIQSV